MPNGHEDHPTIAESVVFFLVYLGLGFTAFTILGNLSAGIWILIILVSLLIVFLQNLHKFKK
ncbi:hypothetical protein CU304_07310 [Prochlorococcus marinus str. MU1415]|jgi:hypothetical protein|nr:hypothetical protein [Prochlorococcus marinus str. MU1415]